MKYWYYYSSEEFSAYILKRPNDWSPEDHDPQFSSHYHGPFTSIRECRREVVAKIKGDIDEFKRMLKDVRGPAQE